MSSTKCHPNSLESLFFSTRACQSWIFNLFVGCNAISKECSNKLKQFFSWSLWTLTTTAIKVKWTVQEKKTENKLEKEAIYNRKTGGNFIDCTKSAITMVNTYTREFFFFLNTRNNGSQLYSTKMTTPKMQKENWDWKCRR